MAAKIWNVINSEIGNETVQPNATLSLPGTTGLSVEYELARGGLSDGVEVLTLVNGDAKIRVIPTRGMSVWEMTLGEQRLGWKSPVRGPVHPKFVDVGEPSGLGWLDGFDELLVRCGLESNGAPEFSENGALKYPLHGRIGNKPAHLVDVSIDVYPAEVVALLGPSGSGKSTLLNVIGCILVPSSGSMALDGEDVIRDGVWLRSNLRRLRLDKIGC